MSVQAAILEKRIRALIDDELFKAYWDAAEHFKTRDLVMVFDEEEEDDPLSCFSRLKLINDPGLPESLRVKLSKAARDAAGQLRDSESAFWFLAFFLDNEMACVAVKAKLIAPGGHA